MFLLHIIQILRQKAGQFLRSDSGMTLPLLAFSMIALTAFSGIAIDTARMQMVQSKLQFSLDAAGLAASSTVSTANVSTEVSKYLNANFNGYMGATLNGSNVTVDATNTIFTLTAAATMPTTFMGVVGINQINVSATSQITRAVTGIELVLVLDNTGSMANSAGGSVSKITALKTAATTLVNTVLTANSSNVWVGIVPFSQTVNVGTNATSILDTAWDTTHLSWPPATWAGCVDARLGGEDTTDDPPTSTSTLFHQYYNPCPSGQQWNAALTACVSECTNGYTWNGSACTCPAGKQIVGSQCVSACSNGYTWNGSACACASGSHVSGSSCVANCTNGYTWNGSVCVCPAADHVSGSSCVANCSNGYTWNTTSNSCVCPSGYSVSGSSCVSNCASGYTWNGSVCVINGPN